MAHGSVSTSQLTLQRGGAVCLLPDSLTYNASWHCPSTRANHHHRAMHPAYLIYQFVSVEQAPCRWVVSACVLTPLRKSSSVLTAFCAFQDGVFDRDVACSCPLSCLCVSLHLRAGTGDVRLIRCLTSRQSFISSCRRFKFAMHVCSGRKVPS